MTSEESFKATTTAKSRYSLNLVVVTTSLTAVVIGTGSWTAIEFLTGERPSLSDIFSHHLIPAVVIGLVIWITLTALLHRSVIEPIKQLFAHLYRVGSGRLDPIEVDSRIQEIQTMVDGINMLVRRLQSAPENTSFNQAQNRLSKIRGDIRSMADAAGEDSPIFLAVVKELRALEGDILALGRASAK